MTVLAVDIGGTKIAAARVSGEGAVAGPVRTVATPSADAAAVVAAVVAVLSELTGPDATAIGISSAGVVDSAGGVVLGATSSMPGWAGTPLADEVGRAVGLPAYALGDGHAFALGEAVHGAARDAGSVLVIAVGTGVGGSYVTSREPHFGGHWAGGQFGHVAVPQAEGIACYCGRTGHLEAIASGAGILRWYRLHGGAADIGGTEDLFPRAAHDPLAARAIHLGASALGTAAGSLANAFDPDLIVVTGGVSRAGPRWETPMRTAYARTLIPALDRLPLIISEPDAWPALRGAAHYALTREAAR